MKHPNDDDGFGVNSKVHCIREPADQGPAQATFTGNVRERIPNYPSDRGIKRVSELDPESGTTLLVPLERLERVAPGLLA